MVLFIDTHLNDVVVILYENGIIVEKRILKNEKRHSEVIMPLIADVLKGKNIDSIIVVNGPGSFTGVRLGVTIAKTLAYTLNIPIRTITYLECLAVSSNKNDVVVAFSDNNGYYVGKFTNNVRKNEYIYLKNHEFESYKISNNVLEDIELNYKKIIEFTLSKEAINPHQVNPIYIKKLDVEK